MELSDKLRDKNPIYDNFEKINYLGRNLAKKVKDLYTGKYKTLIREIEEDTNKWKDIPYSWIG